MAPSLVISKEKNRTRWYRKFSYPYGIDERTEGEKAERRTGAKIERLVHQNVYQLPDLFIISGNMLTNICYDA